MVEKKSGQGKPCQSFLQLYVVAKQSRCDGVYNRTGDLSVICFGKEERRRE